LCFPDPAVEKQLSKETIERCAKNMNKYLYLPWLENCLLTITVLFMLLFVVDYLHMIVVSFEVSVFFWKMFSFFIIREKVGKKERKTVFHATK
jgi:hypothetical protein